MVVRGRGRMVTNYEVDATGATGIWPDTTHYWAIVPANKVWRVVAACVNRSVSSTCNWYMYDGTDSLLLSETGAGTGAVHVDLTTLGEVILPAGWAMRTTFGTAQNASAWGYCVVEEWSA